MLRLVRSPINAFALGLGLVFSEVLHKLLLLDVCAHYCCTGVVCSLVEITPTAFVVWSPPVYLREWGPRHFGRKLNSEDGGERSWRRQSGDSFACGEGPLAQGKLFLNFPHLKFKIFKDLGWRNNQKNSTISATLQLKTFSFEFIYGAKYSF